MWFPYFAYRFWKEYEHQMKGLRMKVMAVNVGGHMFILFILEWIRFCKWDAKNAYYDFVRLPSLMSIVQTNVQWMFVFFFWASRDRKTKRSVSLRLVFQFRKGYCLTDFHLLNMCETLFHPIKLGPFSSSRGSHFYSLLPSYINLTLVSFQLLDV